MAIQGFFTGDVKIRDLNGVLRAVNGIVEVASDAGTVTSVGLAVGSTGTDVNVANSPITSSGNITLNLPTASATNRGLLSSTDWAIFSAKQGTITLTTTGNNGSATLTSGTLNIPTYTLAGLGGISLTSLSASSPLLYNNTTGAFSIQVANGSQNGYLSSTDWTTFNSKQSALTFSSPLVNTSGTISIPAATSSVNGYLTSTDWSTFNNKQNTLILTTTGSSGASTLVGATLNIPTYTLSGLGGVPTSRQLTINGTAYDLSADRSWSVGTVTSVSASITGNSIGITGSPITSSGTLAFAFAGNATQYVRGDGALATLPTNGGGGGASVSYYLNGSINQGTIGGVTYYEMNKTPIIGAGTDFTTSSNGYIASFLTDANDPALLNIPAGNFNFETYFEASSGGGSPTFYIELYKYDGTTFTLIASNSTNPKLINDGTNIEAYFSALAVPQTTLTLTDRLAVRIYVTTAGRTITMHTENGHLCQVITTFTTGLTALNGLTAQVQYLATGTSGSDFNISSATATHTFNLPTASATNRGALASADWTTFNNKQAAGSYITALTGEATASGPGSATVTLSTSAVTGKLLTGLNLTGGGTIAATDSILQAFGKVQNQISGLAGGVTYQGTWNASTNTPTLTSSVGTKGYYYIVDVAGSTNLNGITDWKIGDWAIFNGTTWDKVDNTDAVSSVNGFTGAVSLTTSNIAEGTNLYYLDSRARLALSFTAGSGAYDNTTGVITIPTNTSQLTNGANFITLSSLSASSPLAYNSGTGAFSIQVATGSQNGYLSSTDWATFNGKQNALTLTTTGSSGSATLVGATLNVPTYTLSGLGGVPTSRQLTINGTAYDLSADRSWSVGTHTGSLTSGYIPKATGTTSLADSLVYDAGTAVLIGTTTASTSKFMVYSTTADNHYQAIGSAPSFRFADTITSPTYTGIIGLATASNNFIIGAAAGDMVLANNTTSSLGNFLFGTGTTERMRITPTGNVSINNTNNTYRFDVNGTVRFTGQLRLESTITDGTYTYTLPSATGTLALTSQIPANPVGGTGTTNYLPKFTGASTIGNSAVQDNGTLVTITSNTAGNSTLNLISSNSVNSGKIQFGGATFGATIEKNSLGADSGLIFNSYHGGAEGYTFQSNGTNVMKLSASGNLGLGVTPSAWATIAPAFQVNSASFSSFDNSANVAANFFHNGTSDRYINNGFATLYQQYTGRHIWYTAPSGTAGNAISFTQAMTLGSNSGLSIGTTTAAASNGLLVAGAATFSSGVSANAPSGSSDVFKFSSVSSASGNGVLYSYSDANGVQNGIGSNFSINSAGAVSRPNTSLSAWFIAMDNRTSPSFSVNYINTGGTFSTPFTIASTGAATFSSSVTATQFGVADGQKFLSNGGTQSYYAPNSGASEIGYQTTLNFRAFNGNSPVSAMFMSSSGNVGIGTTSPTAVTNYTSLTINGTTGTLLDFKASETLYARFETTSSGLIIAGTNSAPLRFNTEGTERMRITSGGRVAIGTTSPGYPLVIDNLYADAGTLSSGGNFYGVAYFGNGGLTIGYQSTTNHIALMANSTGRDILFGGWNGSTNAERMRITSGGQISQTTSIADWSHVITNASTTSPNGIIIQYTAANKNNTGNPFLYCTDNSGTTLRFEVRSNGGIANYQANDVNLSDIRTKKDITPLGSYWDKFKAIEMVKFKYKDQTHDDFNIGVIAQQVEKVAPEFVDVDGWGYTPKDGVPLKSIYTADLHHATIKVLQEAMAKIEDLQNQLDTLKNK
jgi:predicted heme/steroid binding protein